MWTLEKKFRFEAAHRLPAHDGKCQRLHGHSWNGSLFVVSRTLASVGSKQGMAMDFVDISKAVNPLLEDYLDHHYLNETTGLENPTSEELARWIYERLEPHFHFGARLARVLIQETCTSSCLYDPNGV